MSHPAAEADRHPTRTPAAAGRFYPADPFTLGSLVDTLLGGVAVPADDRLAPAYVVPHAGYRYSGLTAARVYARLRRHADQIRRVVLVGPAHHVPLRGCAAPTVAGWVTALGEVPIDVEGVRELSRDRRVALDDRPHAPEHSLEVQLPFLQRVLAPGTPIVPIVIGVSSVDDAVITLVAAFAPGTVVLCSTDLSHYEHQMAAEQQDARTTEAVLDLAPERIGVRDACGVFALRGTVAWARQVGLRPYLLHRCTSADTTGDPTRVVGYAAFAFG